MTNHNIKDYSQCKHYPWVLIDDDCPNCESYRFKKDSNSFYCITCNNFTRHRKKYTNEISCVICNNIKRCVMLYDPKENNRNSLFILPNNNNTYNNFMINKKCANCDEGNYIEYTNASFYCTIDGINNTCIDINRPMCVDCHLKICNKKIHNFCK